jgi:uncharacterized protein YjbI with pentapeptide repeats
MTKVDGTAPRFRGSNRSWFSRQRDDLVRDVIIGVVLAVIALAWDTRIADRQDRLARDLVASQNQLTRELADSAERQENIRFVRQVASDKAASRQFQRFDLHDAQLPGLDLSCQPSAKNCANFRAANLSGADLTDVDLRGGFLSGANLTRALLWGTDLRSAVFEASNLTDARLERSDLGEAFLRFAHLSRASLEDVRLKDANLVSADLSGARLAQVNLIGATLGGADLSSVIFEEICYDKTTTWPEGFTPPRSFCTQAQLEDWGRR